MQKFLNRRFISYLVIALIAVSAYFINVEVQSYWGRQALEKAALTNLSLEKALAKAKTENKLVLVDVSAIWCPTCRKLDNEVFANEKVKQKINERFIFSRLEYESLEGTAFLEKYQASGFPNLWLLDSDGNVVKKIARNFQSR